MEKKKTKLRITSWPVISVPGNRYKNVNKSSQSWLSQRETIKDVEILYPMKSEKSQRNPWANE